MMNTSEGIYLICGGQARRKNLRLGAYAFIVLLERDTQGQQLLRIHKSARY
jgi:hypothetical protein